MASSSHSTPYSAPLAGPLSVEPYRESIGFLPLVPCSKCGTKLIGRVSQKTASKGKRFYKCPHLEHTDFAYGTYMFEEQYVEYLVKGGYIPPGCSQIRGPHRMALDVVPASNDMARAGDCNSVEAFLKDAEAKGKFKLILDAQTKIEKIGERLVLVVVANLFVSVLVLLVLLVK